MFDLPTWFWNILAITVFIAVNLVLWLYSRYCKAKGIKPMPPFSRVEKHKKTINKWTDIYIISILFLITVVFGFMIFDLITNMPSDNSTDNQSTLSVIFLQLLFYFTLVSFMSSWLSAFHT